MQQSNNRNQAMLQNSFCRWWKATLVNKSERKNTTYICKIYWQRWIQSYVKRRKVRLS